MGQPGGGFAVPSVEFKGFGYALLFDEDTSPNGEIIPSVNVADAKHFDLAWVWVGRAHGEIHSPAAVARPLV